MIAIIVKQTPRMESVETYRRLMVEMAEKSRAEAGCLGYHVIQADGEEQAHLLVEYWENREALDAHTKTEHFQRIIPQLGETYASPEEATWHQIIA